MSQPQVWQKVIEYADADGRAQSWRLALPAGQKVAFIGSGTSYYLSLAAAAVYKMVTGCQAYAATSSDVLFYPELYLSRVDDDYSFILLSRSGATTEIIRVAELLAAKQKHRIYTLSCRPDTGMARAGASDDFVLLDADEKSVVMTRSFTSMLLMIQLLAVSLSDNSQMRQELSRLPAIGDRLVAKMNTLVQEIVSKKEFTKYVFLGQGPNYGLACESMLKVKEMSVSQSEAYHSLEFRHGPMAMADENMLVTVFISDQALKEEVALLKDLKKFGVKSLVICERASDELASYADYRLELNSGLSEPARLILQMPITQLLGYHLAVAKGHDPDNPRNLTQVVTLV